MDMLEGAYKKLAEKRKMENAKMQAEIAKMLDSDEDDSLEKRRQKRAEQEKISAKRNPGKLKNKWENFGKEQEEAEKKKLDAERRKREKQDREERRKAKKDLEEKGEDVTEHKMFNSSRPSRTPSKIKTNFADLAKQKEAETAKKIQMERLNRIKGRVEAGIGRAGIGFDAGITNFSKNPR